MKSNLEEANQIRKNEPVDFGQPVDDGDGALRVAAEGNALVVQLVRNQRLVELAVPQLQQRCRHMSVAHLTCPPPPKKKTVLDETW